MNVFRFSSSQVLIPAAAALACLGCVVTTAPASGPEEPEPAADTAERTSYERPRETRELVTDDQLNRFVNEAGVPIYDGSAPPDIAGTYLFGDVDIAYSEGNTWKDVSFWCHREVTLSPGGASHSYEISTTSPNCDVSSSGVQNYISGDGECFTLYGAMQGDFEGCEARGVRVLSACLDESGDMADPLNATLVHSLEGGTCGGMVAQGRIPGEGELAATAQADGSAERIN